MKYFVWLFFIFCFSLQVSTFLKSDTTAEEDAEFIRESIKSDRKNKLKLFLVKCLACVAIVGILFYTFWEKRIVVEKIEITTNDETTSLNIDEFLRCHKAINYTEVKSIKIISPTNQKKKFKGFMAQEYVVRWLLRNQFNVQNTRKNPPVNEAVGPFKSVKDLKKELNKFR